MQFKDTNELFQKNLQDHEYAMGYLKTSYEEDGVEAWFYALKKVARANTPSANTPSVSEVDKKNDFIKKSVLIEEIRKEVTVCEKHIERTLADIASCAGKPANEHFDYGGALPEKILTLTTALHCNRAKIRVCEYVIFLINQSKNI